MITRLEPFDDVFLIEPRRFHDDRGWFEETWNADRFLEETGVDTRFLQDNLSLSREAGVVRGMHYQREPFAQGKLVRCAAGRLFDAVIDIRKGSPTYGRWAGAELSLDNGRQLWCPSGFAHGFATLEPLSMLAYKVDGRYSRAHEGGIAWDDPDIGIDWPFDVSTARLKEADQAWPRLADAPEDFRWSGTGDS